MTDVSELRRNLGDLYVFVPKPIYKSTETVDLKEYSETELNEKIESIFRDGFTLSKYEDSYELSNELNIRLNLARNLLSSSGDIGLLFNLANDIMADVRDNLDDRQQFILSKHHIRVIFGEIEKYINNILAESLGSTEKTLEVSEKHLECLNRCVKYTDELVEVTRLAGKQARTIKDLNAYIDYLEELNMKNKE